MNAKKVIFDCRVGGLANRLRALIGYKALSEIRGGTFHLHWQPNSRCNASITALFDSNFFVPITEFELARETDLPTTDIYTRIDWFDTLWFRYGQKDCSWQKFAVQVRNAFQHLRPSSRIARQVREFAEAHDLSEMLGLHIRHTDNLKFYDKWATRKPRAFDKRSVSELDGFFLAIERQAKRGKCLLCTDDPQLQHAIQHRFGATIVVFPKAFLPPDEQTSIRTSSIEEALVEMILLSKCARIIGTYYSSFSKFSAIWNGAEYFEIRGRRPVRNLSVERAQIALKTLRVPCPLPRRMMHLFAPRL